MSWALRPVDYYFHHQPRSMYYIYAPGSYPRLLGWDKFIFCTNLGVLCLSKILHRTSHSGQHICPGLVQHYFFEVPRTVHIVYICRGCILSSWASPLLFSSPTLVYALYLCAWVVSRWEARYTRECGSCDDAGWTDAWTPKTTHSQHLKHTQHTQYVHECFEFGVSRS